jgi:hypothetical protein
MIWDIGTLGLAFVHRMHLSRNEVFKRTKSGMVTANILSWIFLVPLLSFSSSGYYEGIEDDLRLFL